MCGALGCYYRSTALAQRHTARPAALAMWMVTFPLASSNSRICISLASARNLKYGSSCQVHHLIEHLRSCVILHHNATSCVPFDFALGPEGTPAQGASGQTV